VVEATAYPFYRDIFFFRRRFLRLRQCSCGNVPFKIFVSPAEPQRFSLEGFCVGGGTSAAGGRRMP
jgi:hypothetical protein